MLFLMQILVYTTLAPIFIKTSIATTIVSTGTVACASYTDTSLHKRQSGRGEGAF